MAMLKNKHVTFSLIVCLIVVSPMANPALGGLLGGGSGGGLLNTICGLIGGIIGDNLPIISGVVYCTRNGAPNAPLGGAAPSALAFANADVQLQCGKQNTVVSATTTSPSGLFSFSTEPKLLPTLISDCKLVVTTPLNRCNASLPGFGSLVSELSVTGVAASGAVKVVNIAPAAFNFAT